MIKLLFQKWFGISDVPCNTCEVLRTQLAKSELERADLLSRLLEKDKPEPLLKQEAEEFKPITPAFIPWRVRQQMLEQEDAKASQLMNDRKREIADLEKELDIIVPASPIKSGVK